MKTVLICIKFITLLIAFSSSIVFAQAPANPASEVKIIGLAERQQTPEKTEFSKTSAIYPEGAPFSELVRVDNTLYLAGMIPVKPGTLELVEGGIVEQSHQTLNNIKAVLEANGYSMKNIVKCTVMLSDISQWSKFNSIYKEYFSAPYPARSAMGVKDLALGALLEVECIGAAVL
ncbi:Rid family detoxifying hydrolase [Sessilibacter sp. MAH2]